ncbi:MAG TPA: cardiolipin synthase ClsB [Casimicrobiaceae bacterium]|nr:cardiolipin synthase ClsB [Casimicrobiaceae bacterium]
MTTFVPGNAVELLRSGNEYFPALIAAVGEARREAWLEAYLFADDEWGQRVADALIGAAQRGVKVRVLVDGWGARHYLSPMLERKLVDGGVQLLKYRPDIAPWNFRSNRLRRLHRKLAHVDGRIGFVGGINIIDDMHTPGHKPPRVDFAVRVRGPVLAPIVRTMQRVWAIVEISQLRSRSVRLFPDTMATQPAGSQIAAFAIRDNLRHRNDIELAYLAAIEEAETEILIATAYFFPSSVFRHALMRAAARGVRVTLLLQARVEYRLLHWASRALYGQLLVGNVDINEYHRSFLHAKVAVIDGRWATVGSSNNDPYSFLMAREANLFVLDADFAQKLRAELLEMIDNGSRSVPPEKWSHRSRLAKAVSWIAYGIVRVSMGVLRYGGDEWWRGK